MVLWAGSRLNHPPRLLVAVAVLAGAAVNRRQARLTAVRTAGGGRPQGLGGRVGWRRGRQDAHGPVTP